MLNVKQTILKQIILKQMIFMLTGCSLLWIGDAVSMALPFPNQAGDYMPLAQRDLRYTWQVVDTDPQGLNCRMPKQFHGKVFDDRLPDNRFGAIGAMLLQDGKHDIGRWEVFTTVPRGTKVEAYGGHLGAHFVVLDQQGKPWLPVFRNVPPGQNKVGGHCFVRANRRFIHPLESPPRRSKSNHSSRIPTTGNPLPIPTL